jgi:hypothetical protein
MLDEQIAMGWGGTPQCKIPADWRQRRGPEWIPTKAQRAKMSAGVANAWRRRESASIPARPIDSCGETEAL